MIGNINLYMGKTASTKKVNQGKQNNDKLKKQHHNDFCQQFRSEKKVFWFSLQCQFVSKVHDGWSFDSLGSKVYDAGKRFVSLCTLGRHSVRVGCRHLLQLFAIDFVPGCVRTGTS